MRLNSTFTSNIRDLYGETSEAWLKGLSSLLPQLGSKWNFRFLEVMPDLTYNFVALVEVRWLGCLNKVRDLQSHQE